MRAFSGLRARVAILVAVLVLAIAAPAWAGGPLVNCESGVPYSWGAGGANIPFNPDQGGLGALTNAQAVVDLVQTAFDVWGAIPTATLNYTNAGPLPVDVDITNFGPFVFSFEPDGLSAIVFDDTGQIFDLLFGVGSGVLGFAGPEWVHVPTCTIIESLSFINGPAVTNLTAALDVMVHEFGHYTNFAHTVVNGQAIGFGDTTGPTPNNAFGPPPHPFTSDVVETMYPFYFGPGSGTQTLHADDIAIASTMYPAPSFFATTGTISGTISFANDTTRLGGVNVIARNLADPFFDAVSAISGGFTDSTSQSDPVTGTYTLNGLTPGAEYAVFIDEILSGAGFSTPPIPLPGPEEFWNGVDEDSVDPPDDPAVFEAITVSGGNPVTGIDIIIGQTPGEPLPVGVDGTVQVALPFTYEICGQAFDTVFVNANGNLTFGSGDTDFTESATEFLRGPPRIAALWDDLNPSEGGAVFFTQTGNSFTVHYEDVPQWFDISANSFKVTLRKGRKRRRGAEGDEANDDEEEDRRKASKKRHKASTMRHKTPKKRHKTWKRHRKALYSVDLEYGDITALDGLAGVSCGGALSSGFEDPADLTALQDALRSAGRISLRRNAAVYEVFRRNTNPNDLTDETIVFSTTTNYNERWAEPNDTLSRARKVKLPFDTIPITRFSEIEPSGGDVDYYRFRAVAGSLISAEVGGGVLDSLIGLFGPDGNLIAMDDDGGVGLLSEIMSEISESGFHYLAVTTYPDSDFDGDGGTGGRYVLRINLLEANESRVGIVTDTD